MLYEWSSSKDCHSWENPRTNLAEMLSFLAKLRRFCTGVISITGIYLHWDTIVECALVKCHRLIQSHASALESYSMGIMIRNTQFFLLIIFLINTNTTFTTNTIFLTIKRFVHNEKQKIMFFYLKLVFLNKVIYP